jgi:hypothetical protein
MQEPVITSLFKGFRLLLKHLLHFYYIACFNWFATLILFFPTMHKINKHHII